MSNEKPFVFIKPPSPWEALDLRELWEYRDLVWMLAVRDVKLRYKQTALGVIWVILQPLVAALIFAIIFGKFAKLPSDGSPYVIFVMSGLLVWNYFANALQRAGNSLITDAKLITKVYFPRLLIPLASTVAVLIDFCVSFIVLIILMVIYQIPMTIHILWIPVLLILTTILGSGVSLWLSAMNVQYRDFMYATPFLIQVWMYASPVVYAASIIPDNLRQWFALNPMVGILEGFRWALLNSATAPFPTTILLISCAIAISIFVSGAIFFRQVEKSFADVV